MSKVYIVNKSSHDFSAAERYGKLIYCTSGRVINRFSTNDMIRKFKDAMRNSSRDDYVLLCSLNVMNAIACSVFAHRHGALNLLLYKDGEYVERNHLLD
jgi:hypothetical protein